jgi:hypothetical protein
MARCIELTEQQSRDWDEGGWLSLRIQDDILDQVERLRWHEPVVVITSDKQIAFALGHDGRRV